jgi:ABC-type Mn2+/Zn2+ transport system permease subunit
MAIIAAAMGAVGVAAGLALSMWADTPGGPSIVAMLALIALASLARAARLANQ